MRLRSALFLDFDNVLISLERESHRAAKRFCDDPTGWLNALKRGELADFADPAIITRSLLFLRCYANPDLLQKRHSRPSFVRSGFSVIDCPPLTGSGKNSADIHVVLDAVGLLGHPTHFDEFIILSADADFTPLLVRLREHDRRSVVFSTQETAGAYKAVATSLLQIHKLVDYLDDRKVIPSAVPVPKQGGPANGNPLAERMIEALRKAVQDAGGSIPLATAAQIATAACPDGRNQNWAGFGGFRKLLEGIPNAGLLIDFETDALIADDAARQGLATPSFLDDPAVAEDIRDLARRLRNILDCPIIRSEAFRACFQVLLDLIKDEEIDLNAVSRQARDRLKDTATPLSRANVSYILKGVQLSIPDLGVPRSAEALATGYVYSLSKACDLAGAALSPQDKLALRQWVGAPEEAGAGPRETAD